MAFSSSTSQPFPVDMIRAMLVTNIRTSTLISVSLAWLVFGSVKCTLWPSNEFKNSGQGNILWLHFKSLRVSTYKYLQLAYLLLDGLGMCHILLSWLRRNIFPQFAVPSSRMLRFFPTPNPSSVNMVSVKTYVFLYIR